MGLILFFHPRDGRPGKSRCFLFRRIGIFFLQVKGLKTMKKYRELSSGREEVGMSQSLRMIRTVGPPRPPVIRGAQLEVGVWIPLFSR